MRLSTSTNLFSKNRYGGIHTPYLQSLRRCRKAGFTTIDLSMVELYFAGTELMGDDYARQVELLGSEARSLGVTFNQSHLCYCTTYMPEWKDAKDEALFYACLLRGAEISRMLGVSQVVVHPMTDTRADEYDQAAHIRYNKALYAPVYDMLAGAGIPMAYESMIEYPHFRRFGARAEDLAALADAYPAGSVGVCWDFGHANRIYKDFDWPLGVLGKRLTALHVNDNTGVYDQHLPPYYGSINWEKVFAALVDIGYAGDFTFEVYGMTRMMPDSLRDEAARQAYLIGQHCLAEYERIKKERQSAWKQSG